MLQMIEVDKLDLDRNEMIEKQVAKIEAMLKQKRKQLIDECSKRSKLKFNNCARINDKFYESSISGKKRELTQEEGIQFLDIQNRISKLTQTANKEEIKIWKSAYYHLRHKLNELGQAGITTRTDKEFKELNAKLSRLQKTIAAERSDLKQLIKSEKQKWQNCMTQLNAQFNKCKNIILKEELEQHSAQNTNPVMLIQAKLKSTIKTINENQQIIKKWQEKFMKLQGRDKQPQRQNHENSMQNDLSTTTFEQKPAQAAKSSRQKQK